MLAEKAGIGKCLSFHVARHTFASHLANAGVPLYIVAKLLGDKSLDMVHRVYTNTERTELTEAMLDKKRELPLSFGGSYFYLCEKPLNDECVDE